MAQLRVVGVRHHSPACARRVRAVIAAERPVAVLIEGPSDVNQRLGELALPHQLPVAIYSYCLPAHDGDPDLVAGSDVVAQAGWSPLCAYSPEWVALHDGAAAGAHVAFIDLPGWHPAFATMENRYGDRDLQVSAALRDAAARHGFDSTDALWDHLFEQPDADATAGARLGAYFAALRGEQAASPADAVREDFMADWIAWALADADARGGGTVVVVCGGFHQAALERLVAGRPPPPAPPRIEPPPTTIARTGSYLVPFSFFRLDSFTGYASGMPSPAFYQALWDDPTGAPETMAMAAVARLRGRGQRVSTADAIAAVELGHGLARLRGHAAPTRCDVLDGLAAALIKDALREPVPWSARTVLARGTDPYLVEIVAAFSGDRQGALAPGTPQPPLVGDLAAELAAVGLGFTRTPTPIRIDIFAADAAARRRVLYRLRWLGVPGVERVQRADLRRGRTQPVEVWQLVEDDRTAGAIIECAVWGATLAAAALARLYHHLRELTGVAELAAAMEDALHAGYGAVVDQLRDRAADAIAREPQFAAAGAALARLAALHAADPARGLAGLLGLVLDRALWLLEGLTGPIAALDPAVVDGVVAIRAALEFELPDHARVADRVDAALHRRVDAADAPPAVRGAALGALWSRADPAGAALVAARADALVPQLTLAALGDFLGGVIALARHEFTTSPILGAVDDRLRAAGAGEFLIALPQLRRAFAQFTPQERRGIARRLVGDGAEATLLAPTSEPAAVAAAHAFEAALLAVATRVGALGGPAVNPLVRWRLVLGKAAAAELDGPGGVGADDLARDAALDWLYGRDAALGERDQRGADLSPSTLAVPEWINQIHALFPRETIERLERDAVEEFGLHEVVTNKDVLARIEPSETLLRAVLLTKHLMSAEVLALARELVRKVVARLVEALATQVRSTFAGSRRRRRSQHRTMRNFDPRGTIRANLGHWAPARRQLVIERPLFWSRQRRHGEQWQVVVVVDQSGSMVGSVIHAAVTAACLCGLPAIKLNLVAFDTEVVDLSAHLADPVETLMKVQLGGGTDIARAVRYAEGLVENPARTMVVLITDLFEGGNADDLVRTTRRLVAQGVKFVTLAALDATAAPTYDRELGQRMVRAGASVGAMTPFQLVEYLKGIVK